MTLPSPRHAAFTLIEIMVVIGILAMVLAMGMPSFIQTIRKDPLRQATSDVVEGCIQARAQAILAGEPSELVIEAGDGRIFVPPWKTRGSSDGGESPASVPTELASKPQFQGRLDTDIAVTLMDVNLRDKMGADQARVRFYPNGTSDDFTIVVESTAGVRKISLDCVTGLPDVEVLR
jgi:prepilin-type N-terminal cleavage/methylation domain-containing protein